MNTSSQGSTYISQVRLAKTNTPDEALVVHDDPADLTSTVPTCYTSQANVEVDGALSLELKLVVGSPTDFILIGAIEVIVE